jgi:uncharacterized membrane protein YbhN (UPF0104 family)
VHSRNQIVTSLFNWRTLLSIATSIALLGLIIGLLAVSGHEVDLHTLKQAILQMPAWLLLAYLLLQLIGAMFRALRYRLLIIAAGETRSLPFRHIFLVTMVRNMVVDMLPARLGELLFIVMLNRGYRIRADACVSSLSLSILLDIAILVPVLLVLAIMPMAGAGLHERLLPTALLVVVLLGVALVALYPGLRLFNRLLQAMLPRRQPGWLSWLVSFAAQLQDAFERTRSARVLGRSLLLTAGVRICKYAGLYCLFLAVTGSVLPVLSDLSPREVLIMLIASEATASMPLPTFMSFGSYEAGGLATLTLLGYPPDASAIAILAMHVASQSIDYLVGGTALVLFYFTLPVVSTTTGASSTSIANRRWWRIAAALLIAAAILLLGWELARF